MSNIQTTQQDYTVDQTSTISQEYAFSVGSFKDQFQNVQLVIQTVEWIKQDEAQLLSPALSIFQKRALYQDLSDFFTGRGRFSAFSHSSADAAMRSTVQSAVKKSLEEFNNVTIPVPSDKSQHSPTAQIMYNGRPATLADIILNWDSSSQCFSFHFRKNIDNESSGHDNNWSNQCQWEKDFGAMSDFAELKHDVVGIGNGTCHSAASGKVNPSENDNGIKVSAHHGGNICHPQNYETITVSMSAQTLAQYMTIQQPNSVTSAPLDNALLDLGV